MATTQLRQRRYAVPFALEALGKDTLNAPNPYESPIALIAEVAVPSERDVPDDIARPIKHGWVAACVSGAITLLLTVIAMASGGNGVGDGAWNLVDVGLIALLAFGIYKRSRTAATLMLAYFVLSKILIMAETGRPSGLVLGLLFAIFYFRAMTATYRYHRFVRDWKRNPPALKRSLSEDPLFAPKANDT
ncbi:MAG: hypothetical protein JNJ62_07390 [Pseudoxanthomonas mexicana]|nr:hypothetical protein [Pseudoxanthomonas mexicana]